MPEPLYFSIFKCLVRMMSVRVDIPNLVITGTQPWL